MDKREKPTIVRLSRQRGAGLMVMLAVLVVLAAGAASVYMLSQTYWKQRNTTDQADALNWARSLLDNYVLQYGRLPCPATTQLGAENCPAWQAQQADAKWLPTATLLNNGALASANLTASMQQVAYKPVWGNGTPSTPDVTARPNREYVPAVGQILITGTSGVGINGTKIDQMNNYAAGAMPGTLDFCQKLQNVSLGPQGAAVIQSLPGMGSPSIDPWSANASGTNVFTLSTGLAGTSSQTMAVAVSSLYEALQCEVTHAAVDLMATAASLSEPGGTVLSTRQSMIDGTSGWGAGASPAPAGGAGWGSYEWIAQILMPQIITADGISVSLRVWQGWTPLTKLIRNAIEMPIYLLTFDFLDFGLEAASIGPYTAAEAQNVANLAGAATVMAADIVLAAQYQDLANQLQALDLWGAPSDPGATAPVSAADMVVQQAADLGLASPISTP